MKVYLISGESYLLINEKINSIVGDSKNISNFDLNENSLDEVLIETGYISMFEEEKFIIVKNANIFGSAKLKENDSDLVSKILEINNPNVTIIFVCNEKLDSRKKITKLISEKIVIPTLKPYEIENRVRDYFSKLGFKIEMDTIKYIVSNSLNNYDVVMMEVEKLILFYDKPCIINHNDVTSIVSKSLNSNNFLFVDALVDNDLEGCLNLYHDLRVLKVEPTVLISLVTRDFRIMLNIKNLLEENKREYEIMQKLNLVDWQLDKYLKKVFPYKKQELESFIIKLADLDLNIKSGKVDKYTGLELFILDTCG
ncbi:MAG: DNA polymerase III subunit delta [Ruminococcus sp.]|nr:DNA polymerase III subunit delta [Ruminococcus sp.]